MGIEIQQIQVTLGSLQADAAFDERDADGNILRGGRKQFTLSEATRDALLAEAATAIDAAMVAILPVNLGKLFESVDAAKAEKVAIDVQLATKRAELAAIDAAAAVKP